MHIPAITARDESRNDSEMICIFSQRSYMDPRTMMTEFSVTQHRTFWLQLKQN